MFDIRTDTMGVQTAPKAEMITPSTNPYEVLILYLIPIRVRAFTVFDQYDVDVTIGGASPNVDIKMGVYRRNDRGLSSADNVVSLVPNTEATLLAQTTGFQVVPLGHNVTLEPGDYFIAFMYDENDVSTVDSPNTHGNKTWITGSWVAYHNIAFSLPSDIAGTNLLYTHAISRSPMWAALTYSGDVAP